MTTPSNTLGQATGFRTVRSIGDQTNFEVYVTAAAIHTNSANAEDYNVIKSISIIGDQSAIRSIWALMSANYATEFEFSANVFPGKKRPVRASSDPLHGYTFKQHHLGYNLFHLVGISADECYLSRVTYSEVFNHLKSSRFTVPVIRDWSTYIASKLRDQRKLTPFLSFNCSPGQLVANDKDIEKIITSGLKTGELTIA